MAVYVVSDNSLGAVADAIRARSGINEGIVYKDGFTNAIGGLSDGGMTPQDWLSGNVVTELSYDGNSLQKYALYSQSALTSLSLPNVQAIGDYALASLSAYTGAIVIPKATTINASAFHSTKMSSLDIRGTSIAGAAFYSCSNLTVVVLRNTSLVTLASGNAFTGTWFASDDASKPTTLYVPSALISAYQSATNWSTVLARAGKSIVAIEGSYYETHYADGTAIDN